MSDTYDELSELRKKINEKAAVSDTPLAKKVSELFVQHLTLSEIIYIHENWDEVDIYEASKFALESLGVTH